VYKHVKINRCYIAELTADSCVFIGTVTTVGFIITPPCNVDALAIATLEFVRAASIGCTNTYKYSMLRLLNFNKSSCILDDRGPANVNSQQ